VPPLIKSHQAEKLIRKKENPKNVRAIVSNEIVSKNENETRASHQRIRKKQDHLVKTKTLASQIPNTVL